MKNQAYRMAMLYDFYGDLLTDRQKEFYDLYYNEDLSLAEMQSQLGEIADCIRQVTDLNDKRLGSDELEVLASRIQSLTDKLIQE